MARQAKQRGVVFGAASEAMARELLWGITFRFHHNTSKQAAVELAFHQQATNQAEGD